MTEKLTRIWAVKSPDNTNDFWQNWHSNGLIPAWVPETLRFHEKNNSAIGKFARDIIKKRILDTHSSEYLNVFFSQIVCHTDNIKTVVRGCGCENEFANHFSCKKPMDKLYIKMAVQASVSFDVVCVYLPWWNTFHNHRTYIALSRCELIYGSLRHSPRKMLVRIHYIQMTLNLFNIKLYINKWLWMNIYFNSINSYTTCMCSLMNEQIGASSVNLITFVTFVLLRNFLIVPNCMLPIQMDL